jgi:hypothetical protein
MNFYVSILLASTVNFTYFVLHDQYEKFRACIEWQDPCCDILEQIAYMYVEIKEDDENSE